MPQKEFTDGKKIFFFFQFLILLQKFSPCLSGKSLPGSFTSLDLIRIGDRSIPDLRDDPVVPDRTLGEARTALSHQFAGHGKKVVPVLQLFQLRNKRWIFLFRIRQDFFCGGKFKIPLELEKPPSHRLHFMLFHQVSHGNLRIFMLLFH